MCSDTGGFGHHHVHRADCDRADTALLLQSLVFGLIAAVTIGSADLIAALTSRKVGVFRVLLGANVVAAVLATVYVPFGPSVGQVSATEWAYLFGMSVLIILSLLALYKGLQIGPVAIVSPVVSASSLVAILLSVIIVGERLSIGQSLGAAATVGGVVLASMDFRQLAGVTSAVQRGAMLGVVAMLSGGVWMYSIGVLSQELGWFLPVYLNRVLTVALLVAVQAGRRQSPLSGLTPGVVAAIAFVGIMETIGIFAFARGSEQGSISIVSAAMSAYPLVPIAGGLVIFRERLAQTQTLGLMMVLAGLITLGLTT